MSWLGLSLITAFFRATEDALAKLGVRSMDKDVIAWAAHVFSLPLILALLAAEGLPRLGPLFWPALAAGIVLNLGAAVLYVRALKATDLSLAAPLLTLSPLFMTVSSPLILGEFPSKTGLSGVALIVAGAYALHLRDARKEWREPWRALWRDAGARAMMGVTLLWSVAAAIDKVGVNHSSPAAWVAGVHLGIGLSLLPRALRAWRRERPALRAGWPTLAAVGIAEGISVLAQMYALKQTLAMYVIAVKRLSVLGGVAAGHYFFKEERAAERTLGAALMLAGVFLIALAGR